MSTIVYLGNREAVVVSDDPDDDLQTAIDEGRAANKVRTAHPGKRCTTVRIPDEYSLMEAVHAITAPGGVWENHSDAAGPAWVASTSPALAQMLAANYGCEIREPEPQEED